MTSAKSPFFRDPSFDAFLFAEIGEERNGMSLSMVSALARLNLDPWREAADLSRLSTAAAGVRLASLLSASLAHGVTTAGVARWVGLLPRPGSAKVEGPAVGGVSKSGVSWPVLICLLLAFLAICAVRATLG